MGFGPGAALHARQSVLLCEPRYLLFDFWLFCDLRFLGDGVFLMGSFCYGVVTPRPAEAGSPISGPLKRARLHIVGEK